MPSTRPWVLKIRHARQQLDRLGQEVSQYLAGDRGPRLDVERVSAQEFLLRLRLPLEPDEMWGTLIGDVLHNTRSALDSLAWSVVTQHMSRPLTDKEQTGVMFPIHKAEADFDGGRWAPQELSADVRDRFKRLQPFVHLDDLDLPEEDKERAVHFHPLTRLREWSNLDKHRGLHPVICVPDMVYVGLQEGEAVSSWEGVDPWPWRDGSVISRVVIDRLPPKRIPEFGREFRVSLVENARPFGGAEVQSQLNSLIGHAEYVINALCSLA